MPAAVPHSEVDIGDPNDTITYTCHIGYHLQSGDLIRMCGEDGHWNGSAPVCGGIMYILLYL